MSSGEGIGRGLQAGAVMGAPCNQLERDWCAATNLSNLNKFCGQPPVQPIGHKQELLG